MRSRHLLSIQGHCYQYGGARCKKATLVDRQTDGKDLNEGCCTTENHNSFSVTMETTEQSELAMDCELEVTAADSFEQSKDGEEVCLETNSSDFPGETAVLCKLLTELPIGTAEIDKPNCSETNVCSESLCQDQKEALILESGHEELNRNESVASSVSDTLSSADSVYENEAHRKRQDMLEQDSEPEHTPEMEHNPETEQDPEPEDDPQQDSELEQCPEPETDLKLGKYPKTGQDPEPEEDLELGQYPESEQDPEPPEQYPEQDEDLELGLYPKSEQDPELEQYPEQEEDLELGQDPKSDEHQCPELSPEPEFYPEPEDIEFIQDDSYHNVAIDTEEDLETNDILFEPPITEESILEQCIREEAMSDVSNESCHVLDPGETDECLRVEIAAASSDSDTDEKWRAIFSSSINKEDDDSYLDSLQLSAQELFVQKVDMTDFEEQDGNTFKDVSFEVPQVEDIPEQPEDTTSSPASLQEVTYDPSYVHGLSKISENERENSTDIPDQKHINADLNKKLPKDFCVIQETKSENVSTEHVDFQLARRQWQKMEEQTMNKIVLPTTKQPSFHGSHSFMYTPVRNIERTQKKARDLENLNLGGDYPHTQFSPCSEDSGLDDSSYRSPYDDSETPIEREIRLSMDREEHFRRERNFSRIKSTDCAPSRSIPRSISTPLTPSFLITSSPSNEPMKHEVSANNVIILDPSNDFNPSPTHVRAQSGDWCSEDNGSNIIILETSNLIIRSASEFSLDKAGEQPQEKMFLKNPFFKLRSRSSISLVDEEIKMVKQREDELRKERANLYGKDRFNNERILSNHMDTLAFDNSAFVPVKCKSSPSSPMKTAYRMDRSVLSCDHRVSSLFPEAYTGGRRKSAMALRWEAGEFTKND